MKFNVGNFVTWESCSNGSCTKKTGKVVEVVPKGVAPDAKKFGMTGLGIPRNHESYIVAVSTGKTGKAKPKHYWPRVSALSISA